MTSLSHPGSSWNARGLPQTKLEILPSISGDAGLILITETWAPPDHRTFDLPGYTCLSLPRHYQNPRAIKSSGGLACFIRDDLAHAASLWRPRRQATHMWLSLSRAAGLPRPLFLCLCDLPLTQLPILLGPAMPTACCTFG